ncbi:hypothetical protein N0V90_008486 [Kalmusia sp. IMI 367209]|nr:hypothetical protein N0V90_008486 [Kalmusia sp. IMI 367209]
MLEQFPMQFSTVGIVEDAIGSEVELVVEFVSRSELGSGVSEDVASIVDEFAVVDAVTEGIEMSENEFAEVVEEIAVLTEKEETPDDSVDADELDRTVDENEESVRISEADVEELLDAVDIAEVILAVAEALEDKSELVLEELAHAHVDDGEATDVGIEELELGGEAEVYRLSLFEPPHISVLFPLQTYFDQ